MTRTVIDVAKDNSFRQSDLSATRPFLEQVSCPTCRGDDFDRIMEPLPDLDHYGEPLEEPFASARFEFVRCRACSTVYLRNRVIEAEIHRYYSCEYHCYKSYAERGLVFNVLAQLLSRAKRKLIRAHLPEANRRVLDYGCGSGTWLELIKQSGEPWHLIGTDIVAEQVERVRSLGIEAYVCDEKALLQCVEPGSIGVVHLFHVIEHIPDPIAALRVLAEALAPGGSIIGQTPNLESWDCRLFGKYWQQWHIPRHLTLYTPETLRRHAAAAGLEVVAVKSSLVSATNWAGSVLKAAALLSGRQYKPTQGILYPILTLGFIPLTALQSLVSHTSSIDFIFRKPSRAPR